MIIERPFYQCSTEKIHINRILLIENEMQNEYKSQRNHLILTDDNQMGCHPFPIYNSLDKRELKIGHFTCLNDYFSLYLPSRKSLTIQNATSAPIK